jgi:dTDP-4-amino-4,6-dideoxygalactose transaminase
MITTSNADWDRRFRLLRQHAMSVPDIVRHGSSQVIFESYPTVGYNYRMTDIQAAVGREQLKRLPDIVQQRRRLAKRYAQALAEVPGIRLPIEPYWARTNWQSYCVRLDASIGQRETMQAMLDLGVSTRRGIMCSHREAAYRTMKNLHALPQSEHAQDECILLPLYPGMIDGEHAHVVTALTQALQRQPAARPREDRGPGMLEESSSQTLAQRE